MPAGDGTGPMGMGPMTGRALGYCAGLPEPGYMNLMPGRGMGRGRGYGRGRGRGWGRGYYGAGLAGWGREATVPYVNTPQPYAPPTPEQQAGALKAQATELERALQAIKTRIDELETPAGQEG